MHFTHQMWQAKMLTPGSMACSREPSFQVRKDFSGLFLSSPALFHPSSTATTSLCLPLLPCLPPHVLHGLQGAFTPACSSTAMCHPQSCPACLVGRIPRLSSPSWPPTCLALVLSVFESRNFSPPHCLTRMNITDSVKETDSWLLFHMPGPVTGCGSLKLRRKVLLGLRLKPAQGLWKLNEN